MARIPEELKKAQSDFNDRYYCDFDIEEFSSRANGLMFLDPKNGWKDNYIMFFEEMYRKALKKAEEGYLYGFDSVKMLEDFENTLVMPYYEECIENKAFVNHRPYAGMERAECFEMLDKIHKESPSNPIEFYMDEYKSGKTSIRAMRRYTSIVLGDDDSVIAMNNEDFENGTKMNDKVKIAAFVTVLENINKSRSFIWKVFHPFRNNADQRDAAMMKQKLINKLGGDPAEFDKAVEEAGKTFGAYSKETRRIDNFIYEVGEEKKNVGKSKEAISVDDLDKNVKTEKSPFIERSKELSKDIANVK